MRSTRWSKAGKARYLALSNYEPDRIEQAIAITERDGLSKFVALQPHYNLLERSYEQTRAGLVERHGLACVPFFALAKGFLTGKYRPGRTGVSERGRLDGSAYMDDRGWRVLARRRRGRRRPWHDRLGGRACVAASAADDLGSDLEREDRRAAGRAAADAVPRAQRRGARAALRSRRVTASSGSLERGYVEPLARRRRDARRDGPAVGAEHHGHEVPHLAWLVAACLRHDSVLPRDRAVRGLHLPP